jgi:hypothetical protein
VGGDLATVVDVIGVEAKVQAFVARPIEHRLLHPLALDREHDVEIPRQDPDLQRRLGLAEVVQEREQRDRGGRLLSLGTAQQRDVAVELPTGQQDVALRLQGRVIERTIVVVRIHEQPEPLGRVDAPGVAARLHDAGHGLLAVRLPQIARPWPCQ